MIIVPPGLPIQKISKKFFTIRRAQRTGIVAVVRIVHVELWPSPVRIVVVDDRRICITQIGKAPASMGISYDDEICLREIGEPSLWAWINDLRTLARAGTVLRRVLIESHQRPAHAVSHDPDLTVGTYKTPDVVNAAANGRRDLIETLDVIPIVGELVVHAERAIATLSKWDAIATREIITVRVHCHDPDVTSGPKWVWLYKDGGDTESGDSSSFGRLSYC